MHTAHPHTRHTVMIFTRKEFWDIALLFAVFSIILGVITFVLVPQGLSYAKYPLLHFSLFIFGMALAHSFTPTAISKVHMSKPGIIVIVTLILIGLLSIWPSGIFIERSIKLVEILFQDFIIASTLSIIGTRLSSTPIRLSLAFAFAALHLPLFVTQPFTHALSVLCAAFIVGYIGTTIFQKTKQDISGIIILHLSFYILFGSMLSLVLW